MAPFPLIKLGYLAIKQISKPIANAIKRRAKGHPFFRTYICMPPAQFYHWLDVNFRLRMIGLGKVTTVEKLTEKEAIELGGEMLGEFIVFMMAAAVLLAEYARGARKEAAKEEKQKLEWAKITNKIQEFGLVSEIQEAQIRELQHRVDYLSKAKEEQMSSGYVQRIFGSKKTEKSE